MPNPAKTFLQLKGEMGSLALTESYKHLTSICALNFAAVLLMGGAF
jgi:hypothetical protein